MRVLSSRDMFVEKLQNQMSKYNRAWMHAGWMALLTISCVIFYLYSVGEKKQETQKLTLQLHRLESELGCSLERNEDLLLKIESQNDPAWIELVLMEKLGLVPKGQTKVYFEKEE